MIAPGVPRSSLSENGGPPVAYLATGDFATLDGRSPECHYKLQQHPAEECNPPTITSGKSFDLCSDESRA